MNSLSFYPGQTSLTLVCVYWEFMWIYTSEQSVSLLQTLSLNFFLLAFFFSFMYTVSHFIPFQISYKTHWSISLIHSSWQPCGCLIESVSSKRVPQFLQRHMDQKINSQPWEPQALLSSPSSEPYLPRVLTITEELLIIHHLPGTWTGSLPWSSCQGLSYRKDPRPCRRDLPGLNWLLTSKKIWPHFIFVLIIRGPCLPSDKLNLWLFPLTTGNLLCGKYANTAYIPE